MIKGIHHISMKCNTQEEFFQVMVFYCEVLGLPIYREWEAGIMIDTGNGYIEVFNNEANVMQRGTLRHFALATDDVDGMVKRVKDAGYEVFIEPNDRVIPSIPELPIRMAFCYGPLGEEIEFFCVRE
ncbi:glyoxylase I family protein [Lachnospiraceae bacterium XBB1006]|jgi:glyoxylase I family protein|nr:glyoxylase I family protein [Lachnospiraceae bacterium XBB1006]